MTGSRADYGLLYWIMKAVQSRPGLELQIVACASHLSPEFGSTVQNIHEDGFLVDAEVDMTLSGDSPVAIAKSMGLGCIGFADVFHRLAPSILLLLGDRYETLAAAQTAMMLRIPIGHIHGGEVTEGAVDEAIRHAITKMAHIHFVAAEPYSRRVVQMGEDASRVHNVGAPGLEWTRMLSPMSKFELEVALDFQFKERNFLVTYHPATLSSWDPEAAMNELLSALETFAEAGIIFSYPNADSHGRKIISMIEEFSGRHAERAVVIPSLGQTQYLSALHEVDAIIGNSSSGIIEAPSVGTPTVNLGDRQRGRVRSESIIDCAEERSAIVSAIEEAVSPGFKTRMSEMPIPYGDGQVAERVATILEDVELDGISVKRFQDIPIVDGASA